MNNFFHSSFFGMKLAKQLAGIFILHERRHISLSTLG
jgi:hypothetical protein